MPMRGEHRVKLLCPINSHNFADKPWPVPNLSHPLSHPLDFPPWNSSALFLFFIFYYPIYSLLGPCPMSDVTCSVSTVPSSISLVKLYICFGRLSQKHMSGRTC